MKLTFYLSLWICFMLLLLTIISNQLGLDVTWHFNLFKLVHEYYLFVRLNLIIIVD